MSRPPLSIIIPTYNAMPRLGDCLAALIPGLSSGLVREAIVVDGSSSDQSASLAADMGCTVISVAPDKRGRGHQLKAGAALAVGDWLLFLHADTVLHDDWETAIGDHIATKPETAAYFQLAFDKVGLSQRRVAWLANLRARVLGLPYGDQGLLISRTLYEEIGGYQDLPLMEDVAIVGQLGARRLNPLPVQAVTSGTKFERGGWWFTPIRNLFLVMAYLVGVSPKVLAGWYR
jgi:rSAM/selenodomain-associated transferase 2